VAGVRLPLHVHRCSEPTVTAQVQVLREGSAKSPKKRQCRALASPDDHPGAPTATGLRLSAHASTQKDKKIDPHILVIPSALQSKFPNHDPFFHNVFSLSREEASIVDVRARHPRIVHFDRTGVSYISAHSSEMSAVVMLDASCVRSLGLDGKIRIANVPAEQYLAQVWAEG